MEFIQGDILDKEFVNKYFIDADVVHHLAGVTNVPRTKVSHQTQHKMKKLNKLELKGHKIF